MAVLALILLLGAGGWFWLFRQTPSAKVASISPGPAGLGYSNADADRDGLKNWEETLWSTDLNNSDTDGDGTPDGEEVKENRNPLVKSPNDKYKTPPPQATENSDNGSDLNLTDQFAQAFSNAVGPRVLNGEQISQGGLSGVLKTYLEKNSYQDRFSGKDIKFPNTSSRQDKISYLNAAGNILKKNFEELEGNELVMVIESVKSENFASLQNLEKFQEAYQRAVAELLILPAPKDYGKLHLELLNVLDAASEATKDMQKLENDPFQTLVGVSEYLKGTRRMSAYLENINRQFEADGIILTSRDAGYALVDYYLQVKAAGELSLP